MDEKYMDKIKLQSNSGFQKGISVVIPTYNRIDLLRKTLESLSQQSLDKSLFEVIIVDDGSNDNSYLLVEEFQENISVKYFFQEDNGYRVAKARNIGIRNASFSRVLFFDSGMIASSNLLQAHYNRQEVSDKLVIIGLSFGVNEYDTCYADEIEKITCENSIDATFKLMLTMPHLKDCRENYLSSINFDLRQVALPWILFWTMHVSVPTSELRTLGGFDEWFNSWGGEDVELGLRLFRAGCRFEILPGIESLHFPHFKDPEARRRDSKKNVRYIHQKHQLESTRLLTTMNWEQLILLNV